jgi:hypothetical protein
MPEPSADDVWQARRVAERANFVTWHLLEVLRLLRDEPPATQGEVSTRAAIAVAWGDEMLRHVEHIDGEVCPFCGCPADAPVTCARPFHAIRDVCG